MAEPTRLTPLTKAEQELAADNIYLVDKYLRIKKLPRDEYYDSAVFGYLVAIKKWFRRPDLYKYPFAKIAFDSMRCYVWHERERRKRILETVSIDDVIPGTDGLTYRETVTEKNLDYIPYTFEEVNKDEDHL